jgi:hypothetical protein
MKANMEDRDTQKRAEAKEWQTDKAGFDSLRDRAG